MHIAAAAVLTASSAALAQAPGFYLTGIAPGNTYSVATALSQDGAVAAGLSAGGFPSSSPGFTWSAGAGRYDFGLEPGMPRDSAAFGLSSDGQVIIGWMSTGAGSRAYRRMGAGTLEDIGVLSAHEPPTVNHQGRSWARGISGDGTTVVGQSELWWGQIEPTTLVDREAFRWTPSGGIQPLGTLVPGGFSEAWGISRDGSTIVGSSFFGTNRAFKWTEGGGMEAMAHLPGAGPSPSSQAFAVSADGSVTVGSATTAAGTTHAVRWTNAGPQDLDPLSIFGSSRAYAVSDDGAVIGGSLGSLAMVWTETTGMLRLSDYLGLHGIEIPVDLLLREVTAISGDGLTFAGDARFISGDRQGFVVTIPAPSGAVVLFVSALLMPHRCRRH